MLERGPVDYFFDDLFFEFTIGDAGVRRAGDSGRNYDGGVLPLDYFALLGELFPAPLEHGGAKQQAIEDSELQFGPEIHVVELVGEQSGGRAR